MEMKSTFQYTSPKEWPHAAWMEQINTQITSANAVLWSGLRWIFGLGIQPEMPFILKNNLALMNCVSFAGLLLSLPGSFLLLLAGFDHTFSLLVTGVLVLCLVLALNSAHQVQWSQVIFAFSPAAIMMTYILVELSAGNLTSLLLYVMARQGLCLALLLPILLFGFEKTQRWITLAECVIVFLLFDVASMRTGNPLFSNTQSMTQGLFSVLSVFQLAGLSSCILLMQNFTIRHDQEARLSAEKLQAMAIRDGMTGLFNHTFMEGLISDAINRSKRSKTPLSLLMIDVDLFKMINDTSGHAAGDETLSYLSKLLNSNKRSTDYLGRWGGDEMILLLTDTNLQGAAMLAEKLRLAVDKHNFPRNRHLTISLGGSTYHNGESAASFVKRADVALYRAKQAGRNRVEILA